MSTVDQEYSNSKGGCERTTITAPRFGTKVEVLRNIDGKAVGIVFIGIVQHSKYLFRFSNFYDDL